MINLQSSYFIGEKVRLCNQNEREAEVIGIFFNKDRVLYQVTYSIFGKQFYKLVETDELKQIPLYANDFVSNSFKCEEGNPFKELDTVKKVFFDELDELLKGCDI